MSVTSATGHRREAVGLAGHRASTLDAVTGAKRIGASRTARDTPLAAALRAIENAAPGDPLHRLAEQVKHLRTLEQLRGDAPSQPSEYTKREFDEGPGLVTAVARGLDHQIKELGDKIVFLASVPTAMDDAAKSLAHDLGSTSPSPTAKSNKIAQ